MTEPFDPEALPDADDAPDVDPSPEPNSHDDADHDDATFRAVVGLGEVGSSVVATNSPAVTL